MAFTEYTGDTTIIGALGTNPSERGLTTQEFKDKFDQFAKEFVAWFNETHLPEVAEKAAVYLQEDEPEATNSTTLWFDSNSEINFSGGGVAIYNAETSATPPETVFWFQPV